MDVRLKASTICWDSGPTSAVAMAFAYEKTIVQEIFLAYYKGYNVADDKNWKDYRKCGGCDPIVVNWESEIDVEDAKLLQIHKWKERHTNMFDMEEFQNKVNSIKESMEDYLECDEDDEDLSPASYTIKDVQSFENIMNEFLERLEQNQGVEDKVLNITQKTILQLNELNDSCEDELIETEQREEIITLMLNAIEAGGIKIDDDITLKWREW